MLTDDEIRNLKLEDVCHWCSGRGRFGCEACGLCDGSGYVPTEFGEKVLALMRHNFKPMLEDLLDDR